MCGIVCILMRPHPGSPLDTTALLRDLRAVGRKVEGSTRQLERPDGHGLAAALSGGASALAGWNRKLRSRPTVRLLVWRPALRAEIAESLKPVRAGLDRLETALDSGRLVLGDAALEGVLSTAGALADAEWAIRRDRLRTAAEVDALAPAGASDAGLDVLIAVQQALSALDRLEVRGRDSAGLFLALSDHGLDLDRGELGETIRRRQEDPLFASGAIEAAGEGLGFVYKCASEIGELGYNVRRIRRQLAEDAVLRRALQSGTVRAAVLAHSRWASVGRISQGNAHPLNGRESGPGSSPAVVAAINGDIDNYADLRALEGLQADPAITTDSKVLPVLLSRRVAAGEAPADAFRAALSVCQGSLAVAALTANDPTGLLLALQGSGQGLHVGLADHAFVVASEPYGLVEETSTYLRLDGEAAPKHGRPGGGPGQIVTLDACRAGDLAGIRRFDSAGADLPIEEQELDHAEITTRDIDRGEYPHFLLKEIREAPRSVRKTFRGKLIEDSSGGLRVVLGEQVLPTAVVRRLRNGAIRRILVIGQGTAAVAGQGIAALIERRLRARGVGRLRVESMLAAELSGFHLVPDMTDTLVIAVSQSGTTTDTLRTVNLAQRRGAPAVAIVNRRNSDLAVRSDGVLYTSDGRDVEMSVASTKAFYSQIAAGLLLAAAIADLAAGGAGGERETQRLLQALRALPKAMKRTLELEPQACEAARRHAPGSRDWSVVGNGLDRIAAEEIRIKLSELCYKAIACDGTEDKKHIDLSSEPLILVCATGASGSVAADTNKEVDVYSAHRALPIVIASEGAEFPAAAAVIEVPRVLPELSFVLATVVGHLFGYHAALAIDDLARPLRLVRERLDELPQESRVPDDPVLQLLHAAGPELELAREALASGEYDGHLRAGLAVQLALTLERLTVRSSAGQPRSSAEAGVLSELRLLLKTAIDDLTRHIDTIKHQAKTVTVGISRHDQTLGRMPLAQVALEAGAASESISPEDRRALETLDPFIDQILGYVRYRLFPGGSGPPPGDGATLRVVKAGGLCRDLESRTVREPLLRGTKWALAREGRLAAARGRTDGRPFIGLPEFENGAVSALVLVHVRFRERAEAPELRQLLLDYRERYVGLRDQVEKADRVFDDKLLAELPVEDLLIAPVAQLARRWTSPAGLEAS